MSVYCFPEQLLALLYNSSIFLLSHTCISLSYTMYPLIFVVVGNCLWFP